MKKYISLIGVIMLIVITLNACMYPSKYKWKVCTQLNTKWVSEDGTIVFNVNDSYSATGTMNLNGEVVDVYMVEGPARSEEMHIYPISVLEKESIPEKDKYEYWLCSYKSEKEFVATVKKTTFYEVGQKITFYRVDEIEDSEMTGDW